MPARLLCASLLVLSSLYSFSQEPLINSALLIKQGIELHDAGKYREAIAIYDRITSADSNYVLALYEKALSAEADSMFAQSLKYCEQALKLKSDRQREPELYSLYANVLDKMGNTDRALRIYDSALTKYPAFSALYVNKAIALLNSEQVDKAEEVIRKGLLIDPYAPSLHYYYGRLSLNKGRIVPAMLAYCTYLTILPGGQQRNRVIGALSAIANNEDGVVKAVNERKEDTPPNYQEIEQIIASKIALERSYKKLIALDDPICRQLQVTLEKLSYDESEADFAMQFYVPIYKQIFENKLFEPFISYIFSSTDLKEIVNYNKNNKKETQKFASTVNDYLAIIRASRELNASKRAAVTNRYFYENGKLVASGVYTTVKTGKWNYYHPAGNMKAIGEFNADDKKIGEWKYYYMNGQQEGTEHLKNGELDGTAEYYHENGRPSMKAAYRNGQLHGVAYKYYFTGGLKSKDTYDNGNILTKEDYYETGQLNSTQSYKNNELEGPFTVYFANGSKQKVGTMSNGKLNGTYQYYHDNGTVAIEGMYDNGVQTGTWKYFHENGKIKSQSEFVNGLAEGEYVEYFKNGKISTKYFNKKGKTFGDAQYFDESGRLYCVRTFKDDMLTACKYLDKDGNPTMVFQGNKKGIDVTYYDWLGVKLSKSFFNPKGELEGERVYYNPSGMVSQTEVYSNGTLHGKVLGYYSGGARKYDLSYADGEKDGYYTSYYKNGVKSEEGWYVAGNWEGVWKTYYKNGKLKSVNDYLNGEREGVVTEYWPNGVKDAESYYEDGIISSIVQYDTLGKVINTVNFQDGNGKFVSLFVNGKKHIEGTYTANNPSGEWKEYFADGTVESVKYYKNGLLDSISREYYVGGKIYREGKYLRGERSGEWKTYFSSGGVDKIENFVDGELNGKVLDYYENGKLTTESEYEDGELHGTHRHFDESGELMIQVQYHRSVILNYTYNGKDNKLVAPIEVKNQTGKIVAYYPNGKKSIEFELVDGLFHNAYATYAPNGTLVSQFHHSNGEVNGPSKVFYSDGKPRIATAYLNDEEEGSYKAYYANGQIRRDGFSSSNMNHGVTKLYDEKGKQTETRIFYYGQLIEIRK